MTVSFINILSSSVGLPPPAIRNLVYTAPHRYKVFTIDKRRGGKRIIAQPARDIKHMQSSLLPKLREILPIHDCAYAYRKGTSIYDNANVHRGAAFVLKMDFEDFFPSIKPVDLLRIIEVREPLSEDDKTILSKLFFWKPKRASELQLSIGAPSSPAISNMVMHKLDTEIFAICSKYNIAYTRYADDLTFSTNEPYVLSSVMQLVIRAVSACSSPVLRFNEDKTINVSRRHKVSVTGLVLTPQGNISIGRSNKRRILSLLNSHRYKKLQADDIEYLRGYLAYINSVEPSFLTSLVAKYGPELIGSLFPLS